MLDSVKITTSSLLEELKFKVGDMVVISDKIYFETFSRVGKIVNIHHDITYSVNKDDIIFKAVYRVLFEIPDESYKSFLRDFYSHHLTLATPLARLLYA